jgi:ketosteroid isomerase-like protein
MDEPANVSVVRRALEMIAAGDIEAMFELWEADFVYYGFDAEARPRECRGREDFGELFGVGQRLLERHENEIVDLRAVGTEFVVAHIRSHAVARNSQRNQVADFLLVLHVRNGKIHFACDFIDSSIQDFLDSAWS